MEIDTDKKRRALIGRRSLGGMASDCMLDYSEHIAQPSADAQEQYIALIACYGSGDRGYFQTLEEVVSLLEPMTKGNLAV